MFPDPRCKKRTVPGTVQALGLLFASITRWLALKRISFLEHRAKGVRSTTSGALFRASQSLAGVCFHCRSQFLTILHMFAAACRHPISGKWPRSKTIGSSRNRTSKRCFRGSAAAVLVLLMINIGQVAHAQSWTVPETALTIEWGQTKKSGTFVVDDDTNISDWNIYITNHDHFNPPRGQNSPPVRRSGCDWYSPQCRFEIEFTGLQPTGNNPIRYQVSAKAGRYGELFTTFYNLTVRDALGNQAYIEAEPKTPLQISEYTSGTGSVKLSAEPRSEVTVTVRSSDTSAMTVSPSSLTFTKDNWSTPQTITISGKGDPDNSDDNVKVNLEGISGGYHKKTAAIDVKVKESGFGLVLNSTDTLWIIEGSQGTRSVRLSHAPLSSDAVTVSVASTNKLTVSPSSLTFTTANWFTPQTLTIAGAEDSDNQDEYDESVTLTAAGLGYDNKSATIRVSVDDLQSPGVIINPSSLTLREGDGGKKLRVRMRTQPTATVYVNLRIDPASKATTSPTAIQFTSSDWATEKEFTITASDDDDGRDEQGELIFQVTGGGYGTVPNFHSSFDVDDDEGRYAPGKPTNLSALPGNAQVTLGWQPAPRVDPSDGSPVSPTASLQFRNRLTGGSWSDWSVLRCGNSRLRRRRH